MEKTRTRPWDAADYLEEDEDIVAYLEAAFEDGDPRLIAAALGDIARSRGQIQGDDGGRLGSRTGQGESLNKALSHDGNPGFATVLRVVQALGVRLHPSVASRARPPRADTEDSGAPASRRP